MSYAAGKSSNMDGEHEANNAYNPHAESRAVILLHPEL